MDRHGDDFHQAHLRQEYLPRQWLAVDRMGLEFVIDFPQINPIRTQLRLDGAYGYTKYVNKGEASYYPSTTTAANSSPTWEFTPTTGAAPS